MVQVNSFWIHTNSTPVSDAVIALEARRRRYIVLNSWEHTLIPKIKAANSACLVFVYKDISSTREYDDNSDWSMLPAGVSYAYADARHPGWFLTDQRGKRLSYEGYEGHWQMDVGDTGYQQMWADNVVEMKALGFDGIWGDNALWRRTDYHDGLSPVKYGDDVAFRNAYKDFFGAVCPRVRQAGMLMIANLSNARFIPGGWDEYMEHLDGGFDEWWLVFSDTNMLPDYAEGWRRVVEEIASNEAAGKITLVQPHFSPRAVQAFQYALASYFMAYPASAGKAAIAELERADDYGDPTPWHPEYRWDLGSPTGPYRSVSTNLFRRDFTAGVVLVNANPTTARAVTIRLDGAYRRENGRKVTTVSLPGTSGAILRSLP